MNFAVPNVDVLFDTVSHTTLGKFDAFGILTEQTSADGSITKYQYNLGRLMSRVDVNN